MPWLFEVVIERETEDNKITDEHQYVEAERIEDVMKDYALDSLDEACTIVAIKRQVPICRHVKSYEV